MNTDSRMGEHFENLLRAIAYSSAEDLDDWDTQMKHSHGTLATGDFVYEMDPMWNAAMTDFEPLDLMHRLDGDATRPESVLAFAASVPQIISSSLLPFTVGTISDLMHRADATYFGNPEVDTRFAAHVRTIEDFVVNKESMTSEMGFGLMMKMMRVFMWAKGNRDATLSITPEEAAARAHALEVAANNSYLFKRYRLKKAVWYRAIAEGKPPSGFLPLTYLSPISGRNITRYFDATIHAENFGTPVGFGNMLSTDVAEFVQHDSRGNVRLQNHMIRIANDASIFIEHGGDFFANFANGRSV